MKKKNKQKATPPGQTSSPGQQEPLGPKERLHQKEQAMKSNDNRIDEDFPGYPHHPASEHIINPKNAEDRASADVENGASSDMDRHNGSGGAFEATESLADDE